MQLLNPHGTATRQDILDLFNAVATLFGGQIPEVYLKEQRTKLILSLNGSPEG